MREAVKMKLKFLFIFFVFVFSFVNISATPYFDINLNYGNNSFELNNIIFNFDGELKESFGSYKTKIRLFDSSLIEGPSFETFSYALVEGLDPKTGNFASELSYFNLTQISLQVPYFENAEGIIIYDPLDRPLLFIPVSQFSKDLCGDGICQSYETKKICSVDCLDVLIDRIEEEKEIKDKQLVERATEVTKDPLMLAVIIVGVILLLIVVWILSSGNGEEQKNNPVKTLSKNL